MTHTHTHTHTQFFPPRSMATARAGAVGPAAKRTARDGAVKAVASRELVTRVAADDEKAGIGLKPYNRLQQVKLDVKLDVIQHAQEEQQRIELRLELLDLIDSVRSEELHEVESGKKRRWEASNTRSSNRVC